MQQFYRAFQPDKDLDHLISLLVAGGVVEVILHRLDAEKLQPQFGVQIGTLTHGGPQRGTCWVPVELSQ